MKHKEVQELKNRPAQELEKLLRDGRERLRSLKFNLAAGKVKNVGEVTELKKNIARMLTFLNSKNKENK